MLSRINTHIPPNQKKMKETIVEKRYNDSNYRTELVSVLYCLLVSTAVK